MDIVNKNKLTELRVELTSKCNLSCNYCYISNGKYDRNNNLPSASFYDTLSSAINLGLDTVSFTGGEPLINFDTLLKYIKYCSDLGLKTGILTNATLLTIRRADQLKNAGLQWVRISLDSNPKDQLVQQNINRDFSHIQRAINVLIERNISVILRPTATKYNINSFTELSQFAYSSNIVNIEIQPFMPINSKAIDNLNFIDPKMHLKTVEKILYLRKTWKDKLNIVMYSGWFEFLSPEYQGEDIYKSRCGRTFLFLDSLGRLKTCAMSNKILFKGKTTPQTLKSIWEEHPYLISLRNLTPTGICRECQWFDICSKTWCPAPNTIFNLPVNAPLIICPKVIQNNSHTKFNS